MLTSSLAVLANARRIGAGGGPAPSVDAAAAGSWRATVRERDAYTT
jgi:hypothetical protein